MDIHVDKTLVKATDLSGRIKLSSFKPRFNVNYSSVYQAIFQDQLVCRAITYYPGSLIHMRQFAVNVIKEIPGAQVHTIERKLKRERTTWALLRHPNILPLWGFTNDHELFEPFGALISPWRAQGNAAVFLKDRGKELTKDQRLNMWKGVIAGMQYLHDHKPVLVHGDLKLVGKWIDDQYSPQICDFGLVSIILEEGHSGMTTTSLHTGTDRYLAYELVRDEDTVIPTVASDIFALGCVGLEFYFLKLPYARRQNNMHGRIFADIKAGIPPAVRELVCDSQSKAIWDLLEHCWAIDPSQRPTARELLASLQSQRDEAGLPKHGIEGEKLAREMKNDNPSWPLLRAQDGMFIGHVDDLGTCPILSSTGANFPSTQGFADNTTDIIMESDVNSGIQDGAAGPWSAGQSQQSQFVQGGVPRDVNFSHRSDAVVTVLDTEMAAYQANIRRGPDTWPLDQNTTRLRRAAEQVQVAHRTYLGTAGGKGIYSNLGDDSDNRHWQQPYNGSSLNPNQGDGTGVLRAGGSIQWGKSPSNLGRNDSNSKQKQQGQRNEVDERRLAKAFMPGSFRSDPALRFFLNLIRACHFYLEDEPEPLVGTPEAEQLFAQVRSLYPHDLRFAPSSDSGFPSQPVDNETRDSLSIFMLLTEKKQCLICGAQKDRTGRVLAHVRSEIEHRPYHCTCEKCMQSANPRRFFSDHMLDDHLRSQQVKWECVYCHNLFRRGGMKRHLMSKHPEHVQSAQE